MIMDVWHHVAIESRRRSSPMLAASGHWPAAALRLRRCRLRLQLEATRRLGVLVLLAAAALPVWAAPGGAKDEWFCSHRIPWEECQQHLATEASALQRFLLELGRSGMPGEADLSGRGIVMSGGPGHVLQALANLDVLRRAIKSKLPVEFWHAFELKDFHCEALAAMGATCRTLQVPGVYPLYQTMTAAVLSSSFREVLWIDTDISPLVDLELLFGTQAFLRDGALFWPDLWSADCPEFGQSAWRNHIAWHLLELDYNASDVRFTHEHELGHMLVDKVRHWRPLCLAHYLATRDFWSQVLHGYKDVFRLAWLKLGAAGWLSPVRPGLVGAFMLDQRFFPASMIHFWPPGEELYFGGSLEDPVPLYVHQKKKPGTMWQNVVSFSEPLGTCTRYKMGLFSANEVGARLWDFDDERHRRLSNLLGIIEEVWNFGYNTKLEQFRQDLRASEADKARLHAEEKMEGTDQLKQVVAACPCDYSNNRWFTVLTAAVTATVAADTLQCDELMDPNLDVSNCGVGYAMVALLCSQMWLRRGSKHLGPTVAVLASILPGLKRCLPYSFWPLEMSSAEFFVANASKVAEGNVGSTADLAATDSMEMVFPRDRLAKFPLELRRCTPLPDPTCWSNHQEDRHSTHQDPHTSCLYCCDPSWFDQDWHQECFDSIYTKERCCNMEEQ